MCNCRPRQSQPHANLVTACQPDSALFPPVLRQMIHGREKKKKHLNNCHFVLAARNQAGELKSVLACDIQGYTQLHSEAVTLCHFLPCLRDASSGEVFPLPQMQNVNEIAHICL